MTATRPGDNLRLSEEFAQDGFHSYLRSSLAQAKAERLVDDDLLSSAQADLMITGEYTRSLYKSQYAGMSSSKVYPLGQVLRSACTLQR